jgi:hypothetical protein
MHVSQLFRSAIVSLSSLGLLIPQATFAAGPGNAPLPKPAAAPAAGPASMVIDVALGEGGVFRGQVVDQQGAPLAGAPVSLWRQQQQVGASMTDSNGSFEIAGLSGGMYRVEAANSQANYRLWAPRTAPQSAHPSAMVVAGGDTMRGQFGGTGLTWPRALILAGLVGAAIALPIALSGGDNDAS